MANQNHQHSPGIRFPPPLIFIAGYIVGAAINAALGLSLLHESWLKAASLASFGLGLIGVILSLTGFLTFIKHRTSFEPNQMATRLITTGLYRFSRNPIYLGFTLIYIAAAIRTDTFASLLFLPIVLLIMNRYVITREEQHLRFVFGENYQNYCQHVGRWF